MAISTTSWHLLVCKVSKDSHSSLVMVVIIPLASIISCPFCRMMIIKLYLSDIRAVMVIFPELKRLFRRFPVAII